MKARRAAARLVRAVAGPRVDEVIVRRRLAERTSPATKAALRSLLATYRALAERGEALPSVWETGFGVFSEHDEDGIILFLLGVAGPGPRLFLDIGAADGVHASNCANLVFNLGFDGVFVEADEQLVALGRRIYEHHPDTRSRPPRFEQAFVTSAAVDEIVRHGGLSGEIDVLSIDIDGNDYWIWDALDVVDPRIVVIEIHDEYGLEEVLAPYDESFTWRTARPGQPIGASAAAMTKLAARRGYRLVAGNKLGFNAVYVRDDVAPAVPTVDVAEMLARGRGVLAGEASGKA